MASIISAGTTSGTALNLSGDTSGALQLATNGTTTAVTIDTSQNVGIGTASPSVNLDVNSSAAGGNICAFRSTATNGGYVQFQGSGSTPTTTGYVGAASKLNTGGSVTDFGMTARTNLVFGTNDGTERMRIDSSGNVGIGTTSTSAKLSVSVGGVSTLGQQSNQALALLGGGSNNQLCQIGMGYGTGTTYTPTAIGSITTTQTGNTIADLIFATRSVNTDTAPTERARIDSSGNLLVGTTSGSTHIIQKSNASSTVLSIINSSATSPSGAVFNFSAAAPNNGTQTFWAASDNAAYRGGFLSNGGLQNYQGNNSNLSDQREKKNIQLAPNYLDKICQIPVKTFLFNDQTDTELNLGSIAQDVQAVCPELITESNWGTEEEPKIRLSIYQTDLQYALMKSIQELKAINDTQTETINALTARIVALETA